MTTQTVISYRDGRHFGTLELDMNDPEDAIFISQFKRIPSKNRDYIASLYAREKRRGVNRHVGDTIQPLSLVKQMDDPDVQKSRLTIDKNSLMDTLRRIDEQLQAIQADVDSGKITKEEADMKRKSLETEREKIKARADELGIKIAALNAKSSADGSSPLKPDQLVTIIKKLQEQGSNVDLSSVLTKIESLRMDGSSMLPFISILTNLLDKTFVYRNGQSLNLSKVPKGLELLNKIRTDKRIDGKVGDNRNAIDHSLTKVIALHNTTASSIVPKAGIPMDLGVAEALFRRLVGTLLMAIDFDFNDTDFSAIYSDYYNRTEVVDYLKEIRSIVEDSTHIRGGFKPTGAINEADMEKITKYATEISKAVTAAAAKITEPTTPGEKNAAARRNICAIVLGIKTSPVGSFREVLAKRDEVIEAYNNGQRATQAAEAFNGPDGKSDKTYSSKLIGRAFSVVSSAVRKLNGELAKIGGVSYNQFGNSLTIDSKAFSNVFSYVMHKSTSTIVSNVTKDGLVEFLKRYMYDNPATRNEVSVDSESFERPQVDTAELPIQTTIRPALETSEATSGVDIRLEKPPKPAKVGNLTTVIDTIAKGIHDMLNSTIESYAPGGNEYSTKAFALAIGANGHKAAEAANEYMESDDENTKTRILKSIRSALKADSKEEIAEGFDAAKDLIAAINAGLNEYGGESITYDPINDRLYFGSERNYVDDIFREGSYGRFSVHVTPEAIARRLKAMNNAAGVYRSYQPKVAGYIKVIDRGNPLRRR